jgi:uncharacterized protein (TIGR03663 family)
MRRPPPLLTLSLLVLAAASLAIRLPRLDQRPMHGDEANQAVKAGMLAGMLPELGEYRYDPSEHHGPVLYWLTRPSLYLSGAADFADTNERDYRIVAVVFGTGLVVLLFLVAGGLGRGPAIVAASLTAVSPAMVYYSRYYVQETLLVFFTFAAIGCGWQFFRTRRTGWAAATGAAIGLMHATKETWILAGAAMAASLVLTGLWTRWRDGTPWTLRAYLRPTALLAALAAACVVAVALFSSFGVNWQGPLDSVWAYSTYLRRGSEGGIHAAPWYEYLRWLVAFRPARGFFWTEGLIVGLAAIGGIYSLSLRERAGVRGAASRSHPGDSHHPDGFTNAVASLHDTSPHPNHLPKGEGVFCRFLTFYAIILVVLYSVIPYKTPWCLLSFLHGMILLAGVGACAILRWVRFLPLQVLASGLLIAGVAHLGWETYWLNFRIYADQRNPYVYAHTSGDVLSLAAQMERLAQAAADGHDMMIHVVTPENYWPLPWYLRRFNRDHVLYWQDTDAWAREAAQFPSPSVILLTSDAQATVDDHLRAAYNKQMIFGLRPGVLMSVYVRDDLWQAFLTAQKRRADRTQGGPP